MPGFADSFWSTDYAAGLGVLFGKLQQGVQEDRQMLTIARLRAEAEEAYGQKLGDIAPAADKISGGFSQDEGASVRKAYEGVRTEMQEASKNHRKIAQSIRDLVVNPFSRWCDAHESRIQDSQDELQAKIKAHDRQSEIVKKLRSNYFNKCRLVEDLEEENQLAFQEPAESSPKPGQTIPEIKVQEEEAEDDEIYEIGDETYQHDQIKKILSHMLNTIKMGETKVPILGTYQNTSAGADIVEYLQVHMNTSSVSYAERIGQDMITNGFLRLVGNVGSTFANSSRMFYQWRPKAFQLAGMPEKKASVSRTFSLPASVEGGSDSPVIGAVGEYLANWNVLSNQHPNETPPQRLRREAKEADDRYKAAVRKLDDLRCELEEAIFVHLKFLERCELDRLKAIKTVVLDFSGTIGNVIPSLQATVDNMVLYQETVQPQGDLRYLLENYRTGGFAPKVVTYENYYNKVDEQTFGVDLEARARADKKRVPVIVTTILTFLDHHYPDLEGDAARRGVWLADVPLAQVHALRTKINSGSAFSPEALVEFDIPTVAAVLKLYFLELPDSLVSSHVYEIVRTIYSQQTQDTTDSARVSVLQQTLSQLRLTNIATLDACMNHFTRLIDLTSADDQYVQSLATSLGPCILRPRTQTSLTMEEKHASRLIRDLFQHKEAIFTELKRMSSVSHSSAATPTRPRAATDESNRRAHMEERQRALLEKVAEKPATEKPAAGAVGSRIRGTSPAPQAGHRRDRSSTRFPIQVQTSPTSASERHRSSMGSLSSLGQKKRESLEVPDSAGSGPTDTNGTTNGDATPKAETESTTDSKRSSIESVSKRSSLSSNRASVRFERGRRVTPAAVGAPSEPTVGEENDPPTHGVTLVDKPMDD